MTQPRRAFAEVLNGLRFDEIADPLVSVVVPTYECFEETVACLRALAERTPRGLCEVILVDDGSSDEAFDFMPGIEGLQLVRQDRNRGFTEAVNAGAERARGQLIFLLNNDAEVRSGWLAPLIDAVRDPSVGAVGSRLVYPDWTLQEAGGLVWNDATATNIGVHEDPFAPEYMFRREVDYCSAAALLVRADLFREVGGFDLLFSPGFYEDTDLCFELWSRGFKVLYEPRSVVVHRGGMTFGTESIGGRSSVHTKKSQDVNRWRFAAKWADELVLHRPPGPVGPLDSGRLAHDASVLVLTDKVPEPDRDAGSARMYWILRLLVELGCRVTLLPVIARRTSPYSEELSARGVEVAAGPHAPDAWSLLEARQGLYDVVVLSRPHVAAEFRDRVSLSQPRAVVVYDTVDIHELRLRREVGCADRAPTPTTYVARERTVQMERLSIANCDIVAAVTPDEADVVRQLSPDTPVVVLPTVHEPRVDSPPGPGGRRGLLFIGGYDHPPNVDAVRYLAGEILPRLSERIGVTTVLLGSSPPAAVRELASPSVEVPGYVRDVTPYFDRARVFVAPLRYGAGMKGKIGQAMSLGLPVVTSSIGAEGMGLVHGEHVLVADGADEFVDAVEMVYGDDALWRRLSCAAREDARSRWSPAAMSQRLERLLDECVPPARRATRAPRAVRASPRAGVMLTSARLLDDLSPVGVAVAGGPGSPSGSMAEDARGQEQQVAHELPLPDLIPPTPGAITFRCNVCGAACEAVPSEMRRDEPSCMYCGSTLRFRSVVAALATVLLGEPAVLSEFPVLRNVRGIGSGDWPGYAAELASKCAYFNTFRDKAPFLDLTEPVPPQWAGVNDFVTCSDVLPGAAPRLEREVASLRDLLRPGGQLVLTMACGAAAGGEMGSSTPLLELLEGAGLAEVRVLEDEVPEHGVIYGDESACGRPILAVRR